MPSRVTCMRSATLPASISATLPACSTSASRAQASCASKWLIAATAGAVRLLIDMEGLEVVMMCTR